MKPADATEDVLFREARQRPKGPERDAYLDQACAGNEALRRRLAALLQADESPDPFLEPPLGDMLGQTIRRPALGSTVEETGTWIGRYKLLEKIGEGGCGVVYLAEQEDPIRRRVALKVIKWGMDTRQVIARFEAERQTLALMDHPNIAKVLDAGATQTGRPYFVMELVQGVRITEHCDQHCLSTTERLALFMQVCHALQHAHQKGVIHRDLKPSNILVTLQDGAPVPKVIDFGIAKATGGQVLTDKTVHTAFEQFLGTPTYASPEQAEAGGADIDTRSDIYNLGVVLYELLTGHTPFEHKRLIQAGLDEIRRIIREEEPPRPSTRLSTLADPEGSSVAKRRSSELPQLIHLLRGDLDWIVMKCLEKDRTRRYETANGLADDVTRHLQDEPVVARPPSMVDRVQKSFRRHRLIFTTTVALGLALLLAVLVSTWQTILALVLGAFVGIWQAVRATRAARREAGARIQADQAARLAESQKERAEKEAQRAQASELAAREQAYAADINLAHQALALDDVARAKRLLARYRPAPNERDLRGWEWRYLWHQCRADMLSELCRYPNSVYQIEYAPDGAILAVAGFHPGGWNQGFVEVWDVPGRKKIATLAAEQGGLVAFSPRGDLLASPAAQGINIWQTSTHTQVRQLAFPGPVRTIKFSPGGGWFAAANRSGEVVVWTTDDWSVTCRVGEVFSPIRPGHALAFSPDDKVLAAGWTGGGLLMLDPRTGSTTLKITAHPEPITALAWSPREAILASGSGFTGGPIRLWDTGAGKLIGTLEGHTSWICQLVFSADGRRLYSSSGDQTIRIWEVSERKCLSVLRGSSDEIFGLALSPDGTTLASASKGGIVAFWSALPQQNERSKVLSMTNGDMHIFFPALAPDSRSAAVARDGHVCLYELPALNEIEPIPALGSNVLVAAYSPDGQVIASGSDDGQVRLWSFADRRLLKDLPGPKGEVYVLCFSTDGKRLLAASREVDGVRLVCWDLRTWQPVWSQVDTQPTRGTPRAASLSPDGRLVMSGNGEGKISWWDIASGRLLAATASHKLHVCAVAFSADGKLAASAADDGTVMLWDACSFKSIASFKGHVLNVNNVAFSPDNRRLATGGGGSRDAVTIWDLRTQSELLTLAGEGMGFLVVAFSKDGNWVVASNNQSQAQFWGAPTWAEIDAEEKSTEGRMQ